MTSVILSWSNGTILGSWSYQQECSPYHLPLVKEQINGCLSIITSLANIVPISWPRLLVPSYSCALSCVFSETKREKRKDIALHTTVLSENKREKLNKKAFCNTIFSRTILVIFFSNNNISNIWLYNAWKRHPVVAFSQKLEKTKHLIEAHSMLHIGNKDLCSTWKVVGWLPYKTIHTRAFIQQQYIWRTLGCHLRST